MKESLSKKYIRTALTLLFVVALIIACTFLYRYYDENFQDNSPNLSDKDPGDRQYLPPPLDETKPATVLPDITKSNVIRVIKSMEKAPAYYQEGTVEVISGRASLVKQYKTWAKNGVYKCEISAEDSFLNVILTTENIYYWKANSREVYAGATGSFEVEDVQGIPFVTELYDISEENIIEVSIESYLDAATIFIQVQDPDMGYTEKHWVGAQSGVLLKSEIYEEENLIYRFETVAFIYDVPDDSKFILPDKTTPLTAQ